MRQPYQTVLWVIAIAGGWPMALEAQPDPRETVVAQVGDQSITRGEVEHLIEQRLGERALSEAEQRAVAEAALTHLVDRRLVFQFLREKGYAPGPGELSLEMDRMVAELESANLTLDDFLAQQKMTRDHFEFETAWRLGWQQYLDEQLGDSQLEKYFDSHRRQFDGTRLRVSQIFKQFDPQLSSRAEFEQAAKRELEPLRERLVAAEIGWEEAVVSASDAPSRERNGEVGWIGREGPMSPPFTDAAFALQTGELSPVVFSPHGAHLIRCEEVQPGELGFRDAYAAVQAALMKERFGLLAEYQRPRVTIDLREENR